MPQLFHVSCDNCAFEKEAVSRDSAEDIARQHNRQTGHDVVAVEMPANR